MIRVRDNATKSKLGGGSGGHRLEFVEDTSILRFPFLKPVETQKNEKTLQRKVEAKFVKNLRATRHTNRPNNQQPTTNNQPKKTDKQQGSAKRETQINKLQSPDTKPRLHGTNISFQLFLIFAKSFDRNTAIKILLFC